jgi:hypothetical protein
MRGGGDNVLSAVIGSLSVGEEASSYYIAS